jgi:hypothetical protein
MRACGRCGVSHAGTGSRCAGCRSRGSRGTGSDAATIADAAAGRWGQTLKRDAKAQRTGARAALGQGLTPDDMARRGAEREALLSRGERGLVAYRAGVRAKDSADSVFVEQVNNKRKGANHGNG